MLISFSESGARPFALALRIENRLRNSRPRPSQCVADNATHKLCRQSVDYV
jgi:hypothetical protein